MTSWARNGAELPKDIGWVLLLDEEALLSDWARIVEALKDTEVHLDIIVQTDGNFRREVFTKEEHLY